MTCAEIQNSNLPCIERLIRNYLQIVWAGSVIKFYERYILLAASCSHPTAGYGMRATL